MNNVIEILIVEDSPTQMEHLKYLLEEQGYAVTPTTNGRRALEAARARKPTIIISDIMMPEMDGYALCRTIKSDAALKDIPVILVTDLNSPQDVVMGLQCCADNFITKPYDTQFLLARITQSLRNKELRANQHFDASVEIELAGRRYTIAAERYQILDLLIPTYEEAVRLNQKLRDQQKELAEQMQERVVANERLLSEVAERKRAEETVKESEQRLNLALDSAQMGAWELNLTNDTAIRSLKHDQIFGYPSLQPEWGSEIFLTHVVPEDRDLVKQRYEEAFATGYFNLECRIMWPDQSLHWIAVQGHVYWNRTGDPVRIMGVVTEITERKRAEEALRRAHDELERRVEERTAELVKKNRDLETLLYVITHDLREPLRSIENFSRMVHDRYADRLDEKGKDFLRRVVRGAQRMDRLMSDLLALSRVQRMDLPAGEVEAEHIVEETLRRLADKIKETGATVRITKPLPRFLANSTWATQGVYNLIANALKFSRPNEAPDVEVASYYSNGKERAEVGLVVRDRGPGVAPEHAERIFQLFQRAVGREVEGTGAGLAIVRQVAERHGGRAWVQPREGGGSEFIITFGTMPAGDRSHV